MSSMVTFARVPLVNRNLRKSNMFCFYGINSRFSDRLTNTAQDAIEGCMRVLQVRQDAATGEELTRGLAGELLTAGDRALLELKPLKAFLEGEVRRGMMVETHPHSHPTFGCRHHQFRVLLCKRPPYRAIHCLRLHVLSVN